MTAPAESLGEILSRVEGYYTAKLKAYGPTAQGVDWASSDSQRLRFRELSRLFEGERGFSLLDYGCGYGALLGFLREQGADFTYIGVDLSAEMRRAAQQAFGESSEARFVPPSETPEAVDYTVASGIFNVRLGTREDEWQRYVLDTLDAFCARSRRGFAFNVLSLYSDPEKRRADLYYADPLSLFDRCKRRYAKRVALLHDTPLYEFTILVKK